MCDKVLVGMVGHPEEIHSSVGRQSNFPETLLKANLRNRGRDSRRPDGFCSKPNIRPARFTMFGSASIAYFGCEPTKYNVLPVEDQREVLALTGDILLKDGKPGPHVRVVLRAVTDR